MHKPPTADTRSSEFKTFGASILDDQIDGLTVTLDPEADEICVIAETTHYGTSRALDIAGCQRWLATQCEDQVLVEAIRRSGA